MAKQRTTHFCKNCGFESVKWIGRCPSCAEWNTFVEEIIDSNKKSVSNNTQICYYFTYLTYHVYFESFSSIT